MSVLAEINARVDGYFENAPVAEPELAKHRLVRETCELARDKGVTRDELDRWARQQHGEPSVAVVNASALQELQTRLRRPGGVIRFRARLMRGQ